MNFDELNDIRLLNVDGITISIHDVIGPDRTLLYGYTCARDTFHVFKLANELHVIIYDHNNDITMHRHGDALPAKQCVPDKRVYPESCDFYFAVLLREREVNIPFLPFDHSRFERVHNLQFHGLT